MANLQLSDHLYSELEHIVKQSKEFSDVSAYVSYVLEQVVEKKKQQLSGAAGASSAETYSKEDEDKIRERLKNLGYLD